MSQPPSGPTGPSDNNNGLGSDGWGAEQWNSGGDSTYGNDNAWSSADLGPYADDAGNHNAATQRWDAPQQWEQAPQWDASPGWAPEPAPTRRSKTPLIVALSTLLVIALAVGGVLLWRQFGSDSEPQAATKCAQPPSFVPNGFNDAGNGQLEVTFTAETSCDAPDLIDNNHVEIGITELSSGRTVAEGTYNFSREPIIIAPEGSEVSLTFPAETSYFSADDFTRSSNYKVEVIESGQSAQDDSTEGAPVTSSATSAESSSSTTTSSSTQTSTSTAPSCTNDDALDTLKDTVATDESYVRSQLVGKWVPQISSKQVGLAAEGKIWDACDIIEEYEEFSDNYPNVTLLWSSDWPSFDLQGWWVTVVGLPYSDPDTALAWCDNHGLDREHCYAKKITTSGGTQGTTKR